MKWRGEKKPISSYTIRGVIDDLERRLFSPTAAAIARREVVDDYGTIRERLVAETDTDYAVRLTRRAIHIQRLLDCALYQLERQEIEEGIRDE